jgi:hypothetical protein
MPASKRRNDPFQPPEADAAAPDLVTLPARAATEQPMPVAAPAPERRKPLRYKRPGTSWVTFVVLGFAAVGMAAVGGTAFKKLMGQRPEAPVAKAEKAMTYSALSKDDAVLITIEGLPRDAHLTLDGEPAVSNPLRLLRSKDKHRVAVSAQGFESATQDFTAEASKTLRLHLRKQP